ncbi:UNVERIFIED_CONTAM: hypothetical protein FKN15_003018 [Acipenser sinensis]
MSGFHRCVTCGTKLPAEDPHEDCVSCLGPEHAASALADKAFCTSCANFQTRTLRRRARRAVGDRSPSSGSSHTLSAPQPSLASPPVKLPLSRSSSSQVTAGQRSPAVRRRPDQRGRSRSPRRDRRGGVTELTNKMSQFMDLMMGQQSLLMSLATARAAEEPVGPVANQPMILPQPLSVPVAQQDAWDVDAISRDASEGEPLHGEDSVEAELTSHHSESEMEVGVDDSFLDARRSVHTPRRSALRCFDARCTYIDARRLVRRRLNARCTHLDARRLAHRRLDARCTRLDARCTRLDARCKRLNARRFGASTLGARISTLGARTSTLSARTSTLGTSTLGASVHALDACRFSAWCTRLNAP